MFGRLPAATHGLAYPLAGWAMAFCAQQASAAVLTVNAVGRIDPVCEISVTTPLPAADFATSGTAKAGALVNCNTGFVVKATSANGAVTAASTAPSGFTNSLPYKVALTVPLTGAPWIKATCGSATLVAGQSGCALSPDGAGLQSGGLPSLNQSATIQVSWNTPTNPRLVAGNYEDTIAISVAAAP